jgi:hypothetical protein
MENEEVHSRLAKHLASLGMGYPQKEELLLILKENFTPLEVEVALSIPTKTIPLNPVPVSEIEPPTQCSREEMESILEALAQRGNHANRSTPSGPESRRGRPRPSR